MEAIFLVAALVLFAPVIISIVAWVQTARLKALLEQLSRRVGEMEHRAGAPAPVSSSFVEPAVTPASTPPPLPRSIPPPLPPPVPAQGFKPAPVAINWESVFGVKLFAWVGGLALFLGVVFFVKYAFENNLITPVMRIACGGVFGILLVVLGSLTATRRYRVPAQSLCATGVMVLYADTYAAHAFYNLIPLGPASAIMCAITFGALFLASHLAAHSVVWLALAGGFLTPPLLWTKQNNAAALFGYIAVLNLGAAAVGIFKRWHYLILLAAVGTLASELGWADDFFGPATAGTARIILLGFEAQFVAICVLSTKLRRQEDWSTGAVVLLGFAALIFSMAAAEHPQRYGVDFVFPILFFANVGIIALAVARGTEQRSNTVSALIVIGALALTWLTEWIWHEFVFRADLPIIAIGWYVSLYILFALAPYFCERSRIWPWVISAMAGPLQFWFVYWLIASRFPNRGVALLPVGFALPAAMNVFYLMKRERVALASADSRLASQGAALLFFISAIIPIQFEREWITLGWAIEGVGLMLLFRWLPNRRLRVAALIVLSAAFARLAFNPAVLEYHRRTPTPIWNWYLYAYGLAAICFFAAAWMFGAPRERWYERKAPLLLNSLGTFLCFLLLNIEIADYFSIGPTLTFSFSGNFARDMTYTIAWALFAFVLLIIGLIRNARGVRFTAIALLSVALGKLFLHDLDNLNQLYRIAAFLSVAVIAIVASFAYQRFLTPKVAANAREP